MYMDVFSGAKHALDDVLVHLYECDRSSQASYFFSHGKILQPWQNHMQHDACNSAALNFSSSSKLHRPPEADTHRINKKNILCDSFNLYVCKSIAPPRAFIIWHERSSTYHTHTYIYASHTYSRIPRDVCARDTIASRASAAFIDRFIARRCLCQCIYVMPKPNTVKSTYSGVLDRASNVCTRISIYVSVYCAWSSWWSRELRFRKRAAYIPQSWIFYLFIYLWYPPEIGDSRERGAIYLLNSLVRIYCSCSWLT